MSTSRPGRTRSRWSPGGPTALACAGPSSSTFPAADRIGSLALGPGGWYERLQGNRHTTREERMSFSVAVRQWRYGALVLGVALALAAVLLLTRGDSPVQATSSGSAYDVPLASAIDT